MDRRGLAAALGAPGLGAAAMLAAGPAAAELTQVQSVPGGGVAQSASASLSFSGGAPPGFQLPQVYAFNGFSVPVFGAPGVLTSASLDYDATLTLEGTASASPFNAPGAPPAQVSAPAQASATISGFRLNQGQGVAFDLGCAAATAGAGCSAQMSQSAALHVSQTFTDLASLHDFAVAGQQGIGETVSVSTGLGFPTALTTPTFNLATTATLTPSNLSLTYGYLNHADPSLVAGPFSARQWGLDFGTVYQGDAATLSQSIFNRGDANSIGLDLDSFAAGAGGLGPFSSDLADFADLAAGAADGFHVFLDTSQLGLFSATLTFNLSDADVGYGQSSYQMSLALSGEVVARPQGSPGGVPEPATWALTIAGFGLAGARLRRRRAAA